MAVPCLQTREPGGTKLADRIRQLLVETQAEALEPTAELLLYNAARCQHLARVIRPALAAGQVVVCDRFADATVAYQGHGRGLSLEMIAQLNRWSCGDLQPDLTLLLDCEPQQGLARSIARLEQQDSKEGRFEKEALDFHRRVRSGYLKIAKQEPNRVVVIDANKSVGEVFAAIQQVLSR